MTKGDNNQKPAISMDIADPNPNGDSSRRSSKRPGRGLVTLLLVLLTGVGILLFSIQRTRRNALLMFLPCYCACIIAYCMYLCCVKNSDESNEEGPEPAILREYLQKQNSQRASSAKSSRRISMNKTNSTLDIEKDGMGHRYTMSETLSLDEVETPSAMSSIDSDDQPVYAEFFSQNFPNLSRTFETAESKLRLQVTLFQHTMRPPESCMHCKNGTHGHGASSVSSSAASSERDSHQSDALASAAEIEKYIADSDFSSSTPDQDADTDADISFDEVTVENNVNLTGKYKLVHNHNFEAFLKSQNVPMLLRKAANASRPIHTITHNGNTLRIQVDGITKGDTTFDIGGPPSNTNIRHLRFEDHVSFVEGGQAVQVRKIGLNAPPNGAVELIIKRELGNNGHNLLVSSKAVFRDGSESLESVQTFHRL